MLLSAPRTRQNQRRFLGLEMLQAQKNHSGEQSRCRQSLGDYSDYVTHVGNWGGKVAFGAGAEGTMPPALVGHQEEEEQERKQCPKRKSRSQAAP